MTIPTESERRQATIMFADISGFTAMSEKMDPEEVTRVMNGCFEMLGSCIDSHGGNIDKFIGDSVMVLFGVPKALENAPLTAVNTAIAMRKGLYLFNKQKNLAIPLDIHIGINTGTVVAGVVGSEQKKDYTVMGDAVNLASRIEGASEKGQILVGPDTYKATQGDFEFRALPPVSLKGKTEPVPVYEVLSAQESTPRRKEGSRPRHIDGSEPKTGQDRMVYSELVGRDMEMNELRHALTGLIKGKGGIVNVIGEAGIGKSRLMAEIKTDPVMKQVIFLEGQAISIGHNLSFYPIIDLLKNWAGIREDDGEAASLGKLEKAVRAVHPAEADEIVPFVGTLMGLKLSGTYKERVKGIEGEALEKLIFKNVRELLIKGSEIKPMIVRIEDIHWADTSSIELLSSLFRLAQNNRILFLNFFRPNYPETGDRVVIAAKEEFADIYTEIIIQPLDENESARLISNLLNIKGLPQSLNDKITERSGGNPFFIEEVVRSLIDEGAVVRKGDTFEVTEKIKTVTIPLTINEVLMSRIDRLDEETKNLIKTASVIGRYFFYKIIAQVAENISDIDKRLSHLEDIQLIRERKRIDEIEYLFKHALAQEAAYESLLLQRRKQIHLNVARAIEELFPERLPEFYGILAFHYSQGEELDKAEEYLEKAGQAALASAASSEALIFFQKALTIYMQKMGSSASPARLAMFEKTIARAFLDKKQNLKAIEHCDNALGYMGARRKKLFGKIIEATLGFISILIYLYLPLLRSRKEPSKVEVEIIEIMIYRSHANLFVNSTEFFLSGLIVTRRLLAWNPLSIPSGLNMLCNISQFLSFSGISFTLANKILDFIEPHLKNDLDRFSFKNAELSLNLFSGMRNCRYEQEAVDFFIKQGNFIYANYYLQFNGEIFVSRGFFTEAEEMARKLLEIAESYGNEGALLLQYNILIFIDHATRSTSGMLEHENLRIDQTKKMGDRMVVKLFLAYKTDALMMRGNMQEAAVLIDEMASLIQEEKFLIADLVLPPLMSMLSFNIHSYNLAKDEKKRKEIIKKSNHLLKQIRKYGPKLIFRYPEALRLSGTFCLLAGRQSEALKYWQEGLALGERLGTKPEFGRISFEVAKYLSSPGSRVKTLGKLGFEHYAKVAREIFVEIGLDVDLKELDEWERGLMNK